MRRGGGVRDNNGRGTQMKLGELLNTKDLKHRVAVSVDPDDTISATIQKMVEHDRGSLPVCNDSGELVGIITERDIVRKCFSGGTDCSKYRIKDVMSRKVVVGKTDDDLDYAINVMKTERIRHLPVVDGKKVIGMISMRDLLGIQLEQCQTKARFLSDYISGGSLPDSC
jgi:CBS domain-containing protein